MKNSLLRSSALMAFASIAFAASAAPTAFYGGDPDFVNGLASEMNTAVSDARVYDDFTVGSTLSVGSVFGNFLSSTGVTGLHYEIRQGVSEGDGGTLLYSGDLTASVHDTSTNAFGLEIYRISGSPVGVTLDPGTYFLDVAAIGDGNGRAFLATTSGANGVGGPIANGNSFLDSSAFGADFASASNFGTSNFSMGVTQAVPEPASLAALGLGAVGLLRRRRK